MKTIFSVFAFVLAITFAEEVSDSEAGQKYDAALNELYEIRDKMDTGVTEELQKQYDKKFDEVLVLRGEWEKEELAAASEADKPFFEKSLELTRITQQLRSDMDNADLIAAYHKLMAELNEMSI